MTNIKAAATYGIRDVENPQLRKAAKEMEALFVHQMYKAMRATIPESASGITSAGETMFTDMLDEQIAADTPDQWASTSGIKRKASNLQDAIYKQLCSKL